MPSEVARKVEADLAAFVVEYSHVSWVNATYINHDTDTLAAKYGTELTLKQVAYAGEAARYARIEGLDEETRRKLDMLRNGVSLPAPTRAGAAQELNDIATRLGSAYGRGKGTLNGQPINGSDIEAEMGNLERTPAEYKEMWASWHDNVGAPMRQDYTRMTALANEGAKELGFADFGAMWRSGYDMPPEQFAAETERMWQEVKPLYIALHTYVRRKLNEKYGDAVQPRTGPIRADLLGNMWAQEWGNIYPLVAPPGQRYANEIVANAPPDGRTIGLAALAAMWRKPWTARARVEREPLKRTVWTLSAARGAARTTRSNSGTSSTWSLPLSCRCMPPLQARHGRAWR